MRDSCAIVCVFVVLLCTYIHTRPLVQVGTEANSVNAYGSSPRSHRSPMCSLGS